MGFLYREFGKISEVLLCFWCMLTEQDVWVIIWSLYSLTVQNRGLKHQSIHVIIGLGKHCVIYGNVSASQKIVGFHVVQKNEMKNNMNVENDELQRNTVKLRENCQLI